MKTRNFFKYVKRTFAATSLVILAGWLVYALFNNLFIKPIKGVFSTVPVTIENVSIVIVVYILLIVLAILFLKFIDWACDQI